MNVIGTAKEAGILVGTGVAGFQPQKTIKFASSILSPGCYVDCRKLPSYPEEWSDFLKTGMDFLADRIDSFRTLAGVEMGGVPHAAPLAMFLGVPYVTVRKQEKDHGLKGLIAGDLEVVRGQNVLVVEDMGTTGDSLFRAVKILREAGAVVTDGLFLVTYNFPELSKAALELKLRVHAITTFAQILERGVAGGRVEKPHENLIRHWLKDPWAEWQWY
jgi:orotate phosphoribosyltransferase